MYGPQQIFTFVIKLLAITIYRWVTFRLLSIMWRQTHASDRRIAVIVISNKMRELYIITTWQKVLLFLHSQMMLLSAFPGVSGVTPTISIWQELALNLQYFTPIIPVISLSASTQQHPQSYKHNTSNQCCTTALNLKQWQFKFNAPYFGYMNLEIH